MLVIANPEFSSILYSNLLNPLRDVILPPTVKYPFQFVVTTH